MNILKEMKKSTMISAAIYVIIGAILTFFPDSTARTIGYAVATVILITGLCFLYRYVTKDISLMLVGNELVIGLILVVAAIFVYVKVDIVVGIIPVVLGIIIEVSGISKLQNAIALHRMNYKGQTAVLLFAILNILLGILLIFNPFKAATTLIMLLGMGLMFSGITDFITTFIITGNVSKAMKKGQFIEVDGREVEESETEE